MKIKLITIIILLFCSTSIFSQTVSKSELKNVLKETLAKSRNFVSDATNSWYYDNSSNDYENQDTLTLNTARTFKRDYCKIVNWTFYKWNNLILENANYCNEPPIKLASKIDDYYELVIEENDGKEFLLLINRNGIQDKFQVLKFTKNQPIDNGSDQFDYTIKLKREH